MSEIDHRDNLSRRKVLECMTWCGAGVLWTISGGVPHSLGIMGEAQAAETRGLTFLQIRDSHVGFDCLDGRFHSWRISFQPLFSRH